MVRIKERYLLVNILYPGDLDPAHKPPVPDAVALHQPTTDALTPPALLRAVRAEIATQFGDHGSGAVEGGSLSVKYLSPATSTFILRVQRPYYRLVWTALTMMDSIPVRGGKACIFRVVHVSGTMRKTEEEAIRRARQLCIAVRDQHGSASGRKLQDPLDNIFMPKSQSRRPKSTPAQQPIEASDDSQAEDSDVEMGEINDG